MKYSHALLLAAIATASLLLQSVASLAAQGEAPAAKDVATKKSEPSATPTADAKGIQVKTKDGKNMSGSDKSKITYQPHKRPDGSGEGTGDQGGGKSSDGSSGQPGTPKK